MYLYISFELLSSTSKTAISSVILFLRDAFVSKLHAIPEFRFDPNLLFNTLKPFSINISFIILHTVVFPFVPVTAMIFFGLSICSKKSGHILIAILPGIYEAFLFNNFRA